MAMISRPTDTTHQTFSAGDRNAALAAASARPCTITELMKNRNTDRAASKVSPYYGAFGLGATADAAGLRLRSCLTRIAGWWRDRRCAQIVLLSGGRRDPDHRMVGVTLFRSEP